MPIPATCCIRPNPDAQRHPASLTKIMTLYLLFERLESGRIKLDTQMEVSAHASIQAPTKLGVRPGQTLMVEDAIKALVTKSANDAAVVIAEHLAGSEDEFARLMTRKARALAHVAHRLQERVRPAGRRSGHHRARSGPARACDPGTLPALLSLFLDPVLRLSRHENGEPQSPAGSRRRRHGIKTGYTRMSGFNLVSAVQRGERRIVAVVLGGASAGARDAKMRTLIEQKVSLASVKRTAPKIAEIADAAPMPAPAAAPEKPVRVASAGAAIPPKPEQPAAKSVNRAPEMRVAAVAPADQPLPGSTEPIRPLLVKTLSVKAAAKPATSPMSLFAPEPIGSAVGARSPRRRSRHPSRKQGRRRCRRPRPVRVRACSACCRPRMSPRTTPGMRRSARSQPRSRQSRPLRRRREGNPGEACIVAAAPAASPAKVERRSFRTASRAAAGSFRSAPSRIVAKPRKSSPPRARKAGSLLKDAAPYTEVFSKGDKRYFRARFAGPEGSSAELACKELQKSKMACFAMRN